MSPLLHQKESLFFLLTWIWRTSSIRQLRGRERVLPGQDSITRKGREVCSSIRWGPPAQIACITGDNLTVIKEGKEPEVVDGSQTLESFVCCSHECQWPSDWALWKPGNHGARPQLLQMFGSNFIQMFLGECCSRCCWCPAHTLCSLPFQGTPAHSKGPALAFLWLRVFSDHQGPLCPAAWLVAHTAQPSNNAVGYKLPASFPHRRNNTGPRALCWFPEFPGGITLCLFMVEFTRWSSLYWLPSVPILIPPAPAGVSWELFPDT